MTHGVQDMNPVLCDDADTTLWWKAQGNTEEELFWEPELCVEWAFLVKEGSWLPP